MNEMEPKIRFLYFESCPHAEAALQILKRVLQEQKISGDVELVEVHSQEEAERYHFLGSPTIQINGMDIERERRTDFPVFGCRVYKGPEETSGVPPKHMIVNALKEAMEGC